MISISVLFYLNKQNMINQEVYVIVDEARVRLCITGIATNLRVALRTKWAVSTSPYYALRTPFNRLNSLSSETSMLEL